ncbi:MAG TPA: acyl carrier protein [Pirellulales bacterium]|jgi:acyl carrier protein
MTVRDRLKTILMDVLAEPGVEFSDELSMENCSAWDSVATVQIVLAVEQEFDVRFTTNEVAEVHSVRGLIDLLTKYAKTE